MFAETTALLVVLSFARAAARQIVAGWSIWACASVDIQVFYDSGFFPELRGST